MNRTKNGVLTFCIVLLMLVPLAPLPVMAQADESCGNIYQIYHPMQMYAPVIIEVQFIFTKTRDGDWSPYGFATNAVVEKGTDFLRFKANENDTYKVWFSIQYEEPVSQMINITYQEGSRPPVPYELCMNGMSAYFRWDAIQVVPEPTNYPISEYWAFGEKWLGLALGNDIPKGGISGQVRALSNSQFWIWVVLLILFVQGVINILYTRRTGNKIRGKAGWF